MQSNEFYKNLSVVARDILDFDEKKKVAAIWPEMILKVYPRPR